MNKASKSCAFFILSKESESESRGEKGGRGGRNTQNSSIFFVWRNPKKKINKHKRDVFSRERPKKHPKKQSIPSRERGSAREEEHRSSHFTRANTIIMALRQTLKQFTSKTTAFAPLLSRAGGVQMYSTVIEGLKYASSHEWYVHRNSFSNLFWVNFRFGFTLLLCCSGTHFFVFFLSLLGFIPV